jgi:hypothetical protein
MNNVMIVVTRGFATEIPKELRTPIIELALNHITPETDFIFFDPEMKGTKPRYEDDGRSMRIPMISIPKKVYAKLDDYGIKEILSEQVGYPVQTQYVITLMLSEEY